MAIKIKETDIDFEKLDSVIHEYVPSGTKIHDAYIMPAMEVELHELNIWDKLASDKKDRIMKSIGTLGSGNHFIELDKSDNGEYWLLIHSGSRNLGVQVASHYQKVAIKNTKDRDLSSLINGMKAQGREKEIQSKIIEIKESEPSFDKELAYLTGEDLEGYLHDMRIAQYFAHTSRRIMAINIIEHIGWTVEDKFDSVHNFIAEDSIIRKGATSAHKGERLVIPLNMKDGALICEGLGNPDWNYSAPHGAGRVMSRTKARNTLNLQDYQEEMKGIYTTSVSQETIDEAPEVYKPADEIIRNIQETAKILHRLRPVYNFKAN